MVRKTPESYVLNACRDYLILKGWTVRRMQSGAVQDKRGIPVRMHQSGTPDLLATQRCDQIHNAHHILWVECKAPNGKQSDEQKQFQVEAIERGELYILAYSIEDIQGHSL